MKVTIEINTENEAFRHECRTENCGMMFDPRAVRELITSIANDCSDLRWHTIGAFTVYDVNGNRCGTVKIGA